MLVMMIVAGVLFVLVMDGVTIFNRYASLKTGQIVDNMRLWEGYYHLRDLTSTADSVAAEGPGVRLLREGTAIAELFETDSMLVVLHGSRTDTIMEGVSELELAGTWEQTGTDTVRVRVRNPDGEMLSLSFPVVPPTGKLLVKSLCEQEKPYEYE